MVIKPATLLTILLITYILTEFFITPIWMRQRFRSERILNWGCFDVVPHLIAFAIVLVCTAPNALYGVIGAVVLAAARYVVRFGVRLLPRDIVNDPAARFILRNTINFSVLIAIWITSIDGWAQALPYSENLFTIRRLLMLSAFLMVTRPAGSFIGPVLASRISGVDASGASLIGAGTMIGYLERGLIVIFILLKHWDAIGFLLTAKGILRFNDLKPDAHRPISEYVMLGTLLSFSIAICVGSVTMYLLTFVPTHKADGKHDQLKAAAPVMVVFDPEQVRVGVNQPWKHLVVGA